MCCAPVGPWLWVFVFVFVCVCVHVCMCVDPIRSGGWHCCLMWCSVHAHVAVPPSLIAPQVQPFSLTSALRLSGGARLLSTQCFASATAAAEVAAAAGTVDASTPPGSDASSSAATVAPAAIAPVSGSTSGTSNSSTSGSAYVQSCVAVLFAEQDATPELLLPPGTLTDMHGNINAE